MREYFAGTACQDTLIGIILRIMEKIVKPLNKDVIMPKMKTAAEAPKKAGLPANGRRRPGRRPGRRPSGNVKRPFSIVLDARELQALKNIARKQRVSVASLIRGAMNAVIFQANPQLARAALEKDVEHFLDGINSKLPMSKRFEGRKRTLKRSLVDGILSEMEKV